MRVFNHVGKHIGIRRFYRDFFLVCFPIIVLLLVVSHLQEQFVGQPDATDLLLRLLVGVFLFGLGVLILTSTTVAPAVWRSLRENGHEVCLTCGRAYDAKEDATTCTCGAQRIPMETKETEDL